MPPKPKPLRERLKELPPGQVAAEKAREAAQLFQERRPAGGGKVRLGRVPAARLEVVSGGDGVEVWLDERDGPPDFRIFNPPTLVEDPAGEIERPGPRGPRRYREDVLAALGAVIGAELERQSVTGRRRGPRR